jgi:hypothetical protein
VEGTKGGTDGRATFERIDFVIQRPLQNILFFFSTPPKKIAGASYLNFIGTGGLGGIIDPINISRLTPEIRAPCKPAYVTSSCFGDCTKAFQTVSQVKNAEGVVCDPTYRFSYSCNDIMPCICRYEDLILLYPELNPSDLSFGGAYPCGDCSNVEAGNSCKFVCGNGNSFTVFDDLGRQGLIGPFADIACTNQGWPTNLTQTGLPNCAPAPPRCPSVLGFRANGPQPKSQCIGAKLGDVCTVSCSPSFYAPNNVFVATCTTFTRNGIPGVLDWDPWNLDVTDGHSKVCVCQGCHYGISDDPSCECQIPTLLKPYVCIPPP